MCPVESKNHYWAIGCRWRNLSNKFVVGELLTSRKSFSYELFRLEIFMNSSRSELARQELCLVTEALGLKKLLLNFWKWQYFQFSLTLKIYSYPQSNWRFRMKTSWEQMEVDSTRKVLNLKIGLHRSILHHEYGCVEHIVTACSL